MRELPPLLEAVSEFAARAAEKLRRQGSLARRVAVFAHTSPFRPGPRWANSLVVRLRLPTCDTAQITQAAALGMEMIFRPGFDLAKAGVMPLDLCDNSILQRELDLERERERERLRRPRDKLMQAMDALNVRYGKAPVRSASTGTAGDRREWSRRQLLRTPHYTTDWRQVPIARA